MRGNGDFTLGLATLFDLLPHKGILKISRIMKTNSFVCIIKN